MRRPRVLLVDDEDLILRTVSKFLRKTGDVSVFTAMDLESALAMIDGDSFDGVVADLVMPGDAEAGWTVIARARAKDVALEAILFTGGGARMENRAYRQRVAFLSKPVGGSDFAPFLDSLWTRVAGVAHLATTVTSIGESEKLSQRQRQLLALLAGAQKEEAIRELTGYGESAFSGHLSPVMAAVRRATGFEIKNACDVAIAVQSTVLRAPELLAPPRRKRLPGGDEE